MTDSNINKRTLSPERILQIRKDFPILDRKIYGRSLVYLDNTATTETPRQVVDTIKQLYFTHKANVHRGVHTLSQEATALMEATRTKIAEFIGSGSTQQIIFTRGTTESINLVAASYTSLLNPGDEIILTAMEHHSNIVPWQLAAERRNLVIKVIPLLPDGTLDMQAFRDLLSPRTKIVSVAHVSNVLGTVNPIKEIIDTAHAAGAVVLIDGAQAIAHQKVNVTELDADFYVFSSHKMYGPCGVGVLYGKQSLLDAMPPYQGGGEMIHTVSFEKTLFAELPFKFEAGTPDFVGIAAFSTAIDYINSIGIDTIAAHEEELLNYTTPQLLQIPGLKIYGTAPCKSAIISFLIGTAHHYDTGVLLDKLGIAVRTGHHCAQPLMHVLGITGTVRASFAIYNTFEECDVFVAALRRIAPILTA